MIHHIIDAILCLVILYTLWRQDQLETSAQGLFESIVYYLCGEMGTTPEEMDEKAEEYAREQLLEVFGDEVADIVEDYED